MPDGYGVSSRLYQARTFRGSIARPRLVDGGLGSGADPLSRAPAPRPMKLFQDASRVELVIVDVFPQMIVFGPPPAYSKATRYRDLRTNEVYQVLEDGKHYRRSPNIYPTDESSGVRHGRLAGAGPIEAARIRELGRLIRSATMNLRGPNQRLTFIGREVP